MTDLLLDQIEIDLLRGNLKAATCRKQYLGCYANNILASDNLSEADIEILRQLVHIGSIVYHNSDLNEDEQPIESGVWDLLFEKYKCFNPNFQVGAEPVEFKDINTIKDNQVLDATPMVIFLDQDRADKMLYEGDLLHNPGITREDIAEPIVTFAYETGKKYRDTTHSNPQLVGTLDKCKYVLNAQAIEKGVFEDPKVKVIERDFFGDQFNKGLINNNTFFRMMLELKYDGTSVVVSIVNGMVVKAESRGDTGMDKATDLTPILYGYRFPHLPLGINMDVKCEAVMTYRNLWLYNQEKGKTYKNCRSAINGLFGSNDGYLYQKYITLVPLKVAPSTVVTPDEANKELMNALVDRVIEIDFINKFLRTGEILRHAYIEGDYTTILFLIKKFVEEAEFARDIMPTMYDGVVLSYIDHDMIQILGRENSINKYQVAVKFNALKKRTIFRGYTYTVGQDGKITPMAHYDPVEFLGTIHTKSSIASFDRFMSLGLRIGDIIEVEYINDVMPYVTKPEIEEENNPNPAEVFIDKCPSCGNTIILSESGKTAICDNFHCTERTIQRMANMMDKLGLKDFAEATMEKLDASSLIELMDLTKERLAPIIGDINAYKLRERLDGLFKEPIYDYIIVGALGFTGIAQETWKKIFNVITLDDVLNMAQGQLYEMILNIKGIGPSTVETIENEMCYFIEDLQMLNRMPNIISSKGLTQKKIRCTGFRDGELMKQLRDLGYDADDNKAVTKDTYILLVPQAGHSSSKTKAAGQDTKIISVTEFKEDMFKYL